jgi:hypothetical protein
MSPLAFPTAVRGESSLSEIATLDAKVARLESELAALRTLVERISGELNIR